MKLLPIYCATPACGAGLGVVELPDDVDPDLAVSGHLCETHGQLYREQLTDGTCAVGQPPEDVTSAP